MGAGSRLGSAAAQPASGCTQTTGMGEKEGASEGFRVSEELKKKQPEG